MVCVFWECTLSALPKYTGHMNSFNYIDHAAQSKGSFASKPLIIFSSKHCIVLNRHGVRFINKLLYIV
jgi:hypothetical protein